MKFDHEHRLWLKSKKSRKMHLNTCVEGRAAQGGRKIPCGVDVIMPDTVQNNYFFAVRLTYMVYRKMNFMQSGQVRSLDACMFTLLAQTF